MSDLPVIDPAALKNLRALSPDDNDEFLREIATIYLEDTPLRLAELDQSLAAGDLPKFTRAAHSIKGSSANLGASCLRQAAEKIEQQARVSGLANMDGLIAEAKGEFARAQAELRKLF